MSKNSIGIILNKIVPIRFNNKVLSYIQRDEVEWYANNCREAYYNEYLDFDFSKDISREALTKRLNNLIKSWETKPDKENEIRLLLKNKDTQEIYGGCTVFDNRCKDNSVTVAYFITPEHQNKGIGYELLSKLTRILTDIGVDKIRVTIQDRNTASIKIAEKVGFKLEKQVKGKYTINNIMCLHKN